MSELEAVGYERQRLLAALLGCPEPPPGIVRSLAWGAVVCLVLVGVGLLRRLS